jgi:aldehyde:ferredoxin oxidoreductase
MGREMQTRTADKGTETLRKIIRVDMTNLSICEEPVGEELSRSGGRGMTSAVVAAEVPPRCDPLEKENRLVVAPGLLSGTGAPSSGRLSIGAKSPLTGGVRESNAGGTAATHLGRLGIAALIIAGKPVDSRLYMLEIRSAGARLVDAEELRGLGNYALVEKLQARYGPDVSILSVGNAGERRMCNSTIAITATNGTPSRHAARGGLGAVMAAKGLKAIVADDSGTGRVVPNHPEEFRRAVRLFTKCLRAYPGTGTNLPRYGTNRLAAVINEAGGYPTRNFRQGRFPDIEKVDGEALRSLILQRGGRVGHAGCSGCVIRCSNEFVNALGEHVTSSLEYETIWAHGANCGVSDLDAIARIDRLCDDYGFDTIDMGCSIALAMEAGVIPFGDAEGAISLVRQAGEGTPLGNILGQGVAYTARAYGLERVPVVKGLAITGYDPRAMQGIGVTYATSPMGADHTAGYAVVSNVLNVGTPVPPRGVEGQVDLSRKLQVRTAAIDSTGLCYFILSATIDVPECFQAIIDMLNASRGGSWDTDSFLAHGREVLRAEKEFNSLAGLSPQVDRLPGFFRTEPLEPHCSTFQVTDEELDRLHEV